MVSFKRRRDIVLSWSVRTVRNVLLLLRPTFRAVVPWSQPSAPPRIALISSRWPLSRIGSQLLHETMRCLFEYSNISWVPIIYNNAQFLSEQINIIQMYIQNPKLATANIRTSRNNKISRWYTELVMATLLLFCQVTHSAYFNVSPADTKTTYQLSFLTMVHCRAFYVSKYCGKNISNLSKPSWW